LTPCPDNKKGALSKRAKPQKKRANKRRNAKQFSYISKAKGKNS
jgi:hypothetical protein